MTTSPSEALRQLAESDPKAAAEVLADLRRTVFVPHDGGQREVAASVARFRILRAGRRWGKTKIAAHEAVMAAVRKRDQMVWWVANNDTNVRRGYRNVLKQLPRGLLAKDPPSERANSRILEFTNGSMMEFYTAGTPDALVGEGVNFVVVDEAALIEESVWNRRIRPTLSDTLGRALIVSTPRGRNWFHDWWHRGQDPSKPNYASWHFTSEDSPYMDAEEIEDARDTLPLIEFRQEYLADFVANAASIFTLEGERPDGRPFDAVLPGLVPPEGWVILGVDLGKQNDFTVLSACNAETRLPCYFDRFNTISWPVQQDIIAQVVRELEADSAVDGVQVVVDSTGLGDVVTDELDERGLDVVPINFSGGSVTQKERMVRLLAADLEHGRAFITEQERDEFESYEYEITKNGRYQFEAASGHDDKVAAKLLQNWGVVHEAPPGISVVDVNQDDEDDEPELIHPDSPSEIMERPEAWT